MSVFNSEMVKFIDFQLGNGQIGVLLQAKMTRFLIFQPKMVESMILKSTDG
jgi:hypothetical protein